jgi:hypothetical protein
LPKFRTTLACIDGKSTMTFVAIPASAMKAFGGRKRVPVVATINGLSYRTTITDMGNGPSIPVRASVRAAAGVEAGDRIDVVVELDAAERTVDVPDFFAAALTKAERRTFDAMSYSHRKEYVAWILDAKKPETRARRIEKAREAFRLKARA